MRFSAYINCDNSAFEDGNRDAEIVRILREIAGRIERESLSGFYETIRDANGYDVGRYAIKPTPLD